MIVPFKIETKPKGWPRNIYAAQIRGWRKSGVQVMFIDPWGERFMRDNKR